MRLKVEHYNLYTYPYVMVTCDQEKFTDDFLDTLQNPKLIIEVLSKSTKSYDRGKKFEMYQSLTSLSEYILVSQHIHMVEQYTRQNVNNWLYSEYTNDQSMIRILGIEVRLSDIYHNII